MEAKTALLVALGVAVGLPYVTVLLLRSGRFGLAVFAALFVAVCLLVVGSDLREGDESPPERE
ncbi:hypothetical protein HWV07_04905 [Natronomonas salina]|uniref:hypothetical protein n=1 Tax=Natronomonas salina TaxID=1710540 RepID=UPI0015B6A22D|nr:hypothetical protein [Natronomonas salina]QLD88406.1 hypothetical protein HWV07_04905 [Natronomonas salina]